MWTFVCCILVTNSEMVHSDTTLQAVVYSWMIMLWWAEPQRHTVVMAKR